MTPNDRFVVAVYMTMMLIGFVFGGIIGFVVMS